MKDLTEQQIIDDLLAYLQKEVLDSSVSIDENTSLKDIGVDSMTVIELVLFLERKHGIHIQEKDMLPDNFKSVKSLALCALNS